MKTLILSSVLLFLSFGIRAQNTTDISLFLRSDSAKILSEVSSDTGDLFDKLGHHGPAIENEWLGFRMYFDKKAAIDIYSKTKSGLELKEAKWYPTPEQQKSGWGADYYKAGTTVGCGGVRLWDGENIIQLNPVSRRSAKVVKEANLSYLEMLSEDVPYKNHKVDILVRVTVYAGIRNAKVEAFALTDNDVQFTTGVNYHKGQIVVQEENYIAVWGLHPEDVAAEKVELGSAIIFQTENYQDKLDDGNQLLLITKPGKQTSHWITSANAREPELNNLDKFIEFIEQCNHPDRLK